MDDPGALFLSDFIPRHDPVLVRLSGLVAGALREGVADRWELVERTAVAPPDEIRAGPLLENLERANDGLPQGPAANPELVPALADPYVAELRPDGRRHIGRQGPGGGRPQQERFARPIEERKAEGEAGVFTIGVALVHLHLG